MRLVLDTNVVVAAVLGSGAPSRLIEQATEGAINLFSSDELIAELADVLHRAHVTRRLARKGRSASEVLALYEDLAERIIPAEISRTPQIPTMMPCSRARSPSVLI